MGLFKAISSALAEDDLSKAVAHIQKVCGIIDDSFASHWFDCIVDEQWQRNLSDARIALLMDYIVHEYTFTYQKESA